MPGAASAIGLGEVGGAAVLGERLVLTVGISGAGKTLPEAACFKLVQPRGSDDLPWLQRASLIVRAGNQPVLEVRSSEVLREPIIQLAVQLSCGYEVRREYTLLASPPSAEQPRPPAFEPKAKPAQKIKKPIGDDERVWAKPASPETRQPPKLKKPKQAAPVQPVTPSPVLMGDSSMSDRLLLSSGDGQTEASLRLSTALALGSAADQVAAEMQREILRLEFRILMALHEQAGGQLSAAERLRQAESALGELQEKTLKLTDKASERFAEESAAPPKVNTDLVSPPQKPQVASVREYDFFSSWVFYGMLIGVLLGLVAWLLWRNYREYGNQDICEEEPAFFTPIPDIPLDNEFEDQVGTELDLSLEQASPSALVKVDVELGGGEDLPKPSKALRGPDSVAESVVDEHFEANPVMELADIMLSFGRVKGAAQALQEYVDNNPQEALQPWMRLMDVYRLAGMQEEFAKVAADLNKYFNVEVQSWEMVGDGAMVDLVLDSGDGSSDYPSAGSKVRGLEDMPRIITSIVRMWDSDDVVGYMYELLRDNRGGQRQGFSAFVASEILFLIELKETANRMSRELEKARAHLA